MKITRPCNTETKFKGVERYDEAVNFVTEKRRVSISSVQRQFRIGYNRAARIIEQMENTEVSISFVPQEKLDKLTRSNHQGIVALSSPISFSSLE